MTDQKTTNDEPAENQTADGQTTETSAQDQAGSDKAATDGAMDDILNDVLAAAGAETKGEAEAQGPLTAMIAERDQL